MYNDLKTVRPRLDHQKHEQRTKRGGRDLVVGSGETNGPRTIYHATEVTDLGHNYKQMTEDTRGERAWPDICGNRNCARQWPDRKQEMACVGAHCYPLCTTKMSDPLGSATVLACTERNNVFGNYKR